MLVGQLLISIFTALAAAAVATFCFGGLVTSMLIYSGTGSLALLGMTAWGQLRH